MNPASGFIDIHSHVLYGLDDGARSLEQSVAMLQLAAASGTTDIIATPHANGSYAFKPELIAQRIEELKAKTSVRIHPGCDFHLQVDNIEDAIENPTKYTLNHGTYLLVEFPDLSLFANVEQILSRLIDAGMIPIISHPERNPRIREQIEDLAHWVEIGCCVQVTAGSYSGLFGGAARACAHELMERGLTHFVASDAHEERRRTPNLREAYDYMVGHWGEHSIWPLFHDNPKAVLLDSALAYEPPPQRRKVRKWFEFWK